MLIHIPKGEAAIEQREQMKLPPKLFSDSGIVTLSASYLTSKVLNQQNMTSDDKCFPSVVKHGYF